MTAIGTGDDLSRERGQALEEIRALRDGGWFWSETTANLLLSPEDGEAYALYDPSTCDLRYSPRYIEVMAELLREDQGAGR